MSKVLVKGIYQSSPVDVASGDDVDLHLTPKGYVIAVNSDGTAIGSGGGGTTQYTEDVASAGAESLTLAGAVRRDTAASSSGTDGDYSTLNTDSTGRLWVSAKVDTALPAGTNAIGKLAANSGVTIGAIEIAAAQTLATVTTVGTVTSITNVVHIDDNAGSVTVDNAGTFAVQDSQVIVDNAGFTDGTSKLFLGGYIYDEVAGTALTENDAAAARINVNRAVVSTIEDGVTRGRYATISAANALKVDGSAVTQPVSGTVSITANSAVNVAQINGVTTTMGNGVSGTGVQRVTIASDSTANIATIGTSVTPGTAAANLGKAEDSAHASGDTGVMMLGVRQSTPTDLSVGATNGDYEPFQVDANGGVWVSLATLIAGEDLTNNRLLNMPKYSFLNIAAGQATTTVKSGAGVFHTLTLNSAATATNVTTIYDNTAGSGTVIAIPAATTATIPVTLTYDLAFATGLTIVTATANGSNMTVTYL